MKVVLINGEAQVGKSTFAEHLANLLFENGIAARSYSFVGIYRGLLDSFMRQVYGQNFANAHSYEDQKKLKIIPGLEITGRDWLIQIGNASRALHPYLLPAVFAEYAKSHLETDVWIIENWGFADEYEFFTEPNVIQDLGPNFKLFTVHLNARATRQYASGEQFDGDNRSSHEALSMFVNPKVNTVAAEIDPDNDYPIDTIALQFNSTASMNLPDSIEEEVSVEADPVAEAIATPEV